MKRMICSYWRKDKGTVLVYLGLAGIFYLVLYLYDVQTDAIWYAALLAGVGLLFTGGYRFLKYCRHYEAVENTLRALPYELREFPSAMDLTEALYQQKTEELQRKVEQLESGMRIARSEMLDYYSLWAHQIKTPISAMHLLLQSFEEYEMEKLSENYAEKKWENEKWSETEMREKQEELLGSMKMELFKTEQYVEMVLSYLRAEDMTSDLVLQWYPLDDMIHQAVRKYSQMFILKKIRLEYRASGDMVLTDEKWMVFVLEQLLSNALKYTPSGCISIYKETGGDGRLVIEDTGIGIQEEDLPRIFEKGFTGYNGRQDKKSTGIGLYLCKTICEKLNHGLFVTSEVGKGTKFYLQLKREEFQAE